MQITWKRKLKRKPHKLKVIIVTKVDAYTKK